VVALARISRRKADPTDPEDQEMTMPDDCEALRKAIEAWGESVGYAATTNGVILAAARRDLARMEAEVPQPKRATLEELAGACLEYGVGTTQGGSYTKDRRLTKAAAVLRKLKEFKDGLWNHVGPIQDGTLSVKVARLLSDLP
jgi:hypothetical protein